MRDAEITAALQAALLKTFPLPEYATFFEVGDATGGRHSRWPDVLGVAAHMPTDHVRDAYRRLRSARHPDAPGGDREAFEEVHAAWDAFCKERGING